MLGNVTVESAPTALRKRRRRTGPAATLGESAGLPRELSTAPLVILNTNNDHVTVPGPCRFFEYMRQSSIAEERHRIARDLHDTAGQALTGALLQMDIAEELLSRVKDGSVQEAGRHIIRARKLVADGLEAARRSIFGLDSRFLKKRSLAAALRTLVRELTYDTGIRATFSFLDSDRACPPEIELQLFRITQEAITNVVKHSHATEVRMRLTGDLYWVSLSISDNGRGFDAQVAVPSSGFGLRSMKERATRMGGRLVFQSQPGMGTEVHATLPVTVRQIEDEDCA